MKTSYATLMQSKYFSAAFNSAIFDGPVRIYFAQFHEPVALKIYFMMQQKLGAEIAHAKEITKKSGGNVMLMIYPTKEAFSNIFGKKPTSYSVEEWRHDLVIGLNGPCDEDQFESFVDDLGQIMMSWRPVEDSKSLSIAEL